MTNNIIYLASPYSHPDPAMQEYRFRVVCRVAARLMSQGHIVFSPICHSHPIAMAGDLPKDWAYWQRFGHAWMDVASEMWVLQLDGWQTSVGIAGEIVYMMNTGKCVKLIEPLPEEVSDGTD